MKTLAVLFIYSLLLSFGAGAKGQTLAEDRFPPQKRHATGASR